MRHLLLLAITVLTGTRAPDFSLFTPDGRAWRLSEMLQDRPVVIYNASGCTESIDLPDSLRLVALRPSVCGGYRDHTGAARRFLGEAKAALIDKEGIVRIVAATDLSHFTAEVARWSVTQRPHAQHRCLACHTRIPTQ